MEWGTQSCGCELGWGVSQCCLVVEHCTGKWMCVVMHKILDCELHEFISILFHCFCYLFILFIFFLFVKSVTGVSDKNYSY